MPHDWGSFLIRSRSLAISPAESFFTQWNPALARQVRVSWVLGGMDESRYEEAKVQQMLQ